MSEERLGPMLIESPVRYYLVKTSAEFRAVAKKIGMPAENKRGGWMMHSATATTHLFDDSDGWPSAIVAANMKELLRLPPLEQLAVMVHEATHVWQHIRDVMDPAILNDEVEAYSMQAISLNLMNELWKE